MFAKKLLYFQVLNQKTEQKNYMYMGRSTST